MARQRLSGRGAIPRADLQRRWEGRQNRREQQLMETRPVPPSFLPPAGQPRMPDYGAAHSAQHLNGGGSNGTETPMEPAKAPTGPEDEPWGDILAESASLEQNSDVEAGKFPRQESFAPPPDDEAALPSIQDLEREQEELKQRRQEEGAEALRALEQEARSQEVERIRSSRIEVPDLGLKKREGNSYLHVSHLNKRYGRKIAVEDISISLRQGEVVGLLGPNGAGKTTCFYMIAGFVHPTRGQVLLDEKNISRWPMFRRARQGISYLPQEASIFRSLSVEQNLLAILEYRRAMGRRERMEMAEFLMERLGVLRLRKQKASTLSGGERRRVEVARALALEPRFLLLDEPFAGIDPIAVSEIKGIIRALAESNIGILITDHNVRDTLDITDRSYIVNLGEILVSGSRAELIASKAAREVYLGAEFQ